MASSSFTEALKCLLQHEGGYTNHPSDPGGPTNWGITLADARRYWKGNATAADMRDMPETVARKIYRQRYWDAMRCDELPAGVDYAVFDYGVNSGVGRAGKVLRRLLNISAISTAVNDEVVARCGEIQPASMVRTICAERLAFLKSLKTFPVFGRGWTRRVVGVEAIALRMAAGQALPQAPAIMFPGKARKPPARLPATIAAGGAIVTGSVAVAQSHSHAVWWIGGLALLLAIIAFFAWRRYLQWRQSAASEIISD